MLEGLAIPGPRPPFPFPVAIQEVEKDGLAEHRDFFINLIRNTTLLCMAGPKLENQQRGAGWAIFRDGIGTMT